MREEYYGSLYIGLINSNISSKDSRFREKTDIWINGMKRMFLSSNVLNLIEIKSEEDNDIPKHQLIGTIEFNGVFEIGGKLGMPHCHYRIRIIHKTSVMFNTNRIMDLFRIWYNVSIYAGPPTLVGDRTIGFERYLDKAKTTKIKTSIVNVIRGIDEFTWRPEHGPQFFTKTF